MPALEAKFRSSPALFTNRVDKVETISSVFFAMRLPEPMRAETFQHRVREITATTSNTERKAMSLTMAMVSATLNRFTSDPWSGESFDCGFRGFGSPDVQIASADRPLVMLFGNHGSHEPDDRLPIWEDSHHVGPTSYLPVQPLLRVMPEFVSVPSSTVSCPCEISVAVFMTSRSTSSATRASASSRSSHRMPAATHQDASRPPTAD